MTNEDKNLLLKDLCARLPYGVKVKDDLNRVYDLTLGNTYLIDMYYENGGYVEPPILPYLRPMSSMTEEEKEYMEELSTFKCTPDKAQMKIDFYLKNHFDYRGLIPLGLALPAPEGMY